MQISSCNSREPRLTKSLHMSSFILEMVRTVLVRGERSVGHGFVVKSEPLDSLKHSHSGEILLCRQDRWKLFLCEDNFVLHDSLIC